jgi:hypothetical protein
MTAEARAVALTEQDALRLYEKLAPYLDVVKGEGNPVAEPWGCYPPRRNGRNDLRDWPLHTWRGPGNSPLCVCWSAKPARRPTFEQFLRIYSVQVKEPAL